MLNKEVANNQKEKGYFNGCLIQRERDDIGGQLLLAML